MRARRIGNTQNFKLEINLIHSNSELPLTELGQEKGNLWFVLLPGNAIFEHNLIFFLLQNAKKHIFLKNHSGGNPHESGRNPHESGGNPRNKNLQEHWKLDCDVLGIWFCDGCYPSNYPIFKTCPLRILGWLIHLHKNLQTASGEKKGIRRNILDQACFQPECARAGIPACWFRRYSDSLPYSCSHALEDDSLNPTASSRFF